MDACFMYRCHALCNIPNRIKGVPEYTLICYEPELSFVEYLSHIYPLIIQSLLNFHPYSCWQRRCY